MLQEWYPMEPTVGPPLPRWLGIYWPWYKMKPAEAIPLPPSEEARVVPLPPQPGITFPEMEWYWTGTEWKTRMRPEFEAISRWPGIVGGTPASCGYQWDETRQGWIGPDGVTFVSKSDIPAWDSYIPPYIVPP